MQKLFNLSFGLLKLLLQSKSPFVFGVNPEVLVMLKALKYNVFSFVESGRVKAPKVTAGDLLRLMYIPPA